MIHSSGHPLQSKDLDPPIKQSYLPLWGKITWVALAVILMIGSIIGASILYKSLGYTSLYCLTGVGVGIVLLIICTFLSTKTRESTARSQTFIESQKSSNFDLSRSQDLKTNPGDPLGVDLKQENASLRQQILNTPPFIEKQTDRLQSIYTPVHCIFEGVFLGNYRAFLSTDPDFLKSHTAVESLDDLNDVGLSLSTKQYQEMSKGCSDKNIKFIISVTQFKPHPDVASDDWSRFIPKLDVLGIERYEVLTDDDKDAWKNIEKELNGIFTWIDRARAGRQNILIHCVDGSSRSAAVIYAYLMSRCGVTLDAAYNFVRSIRPHVVIKSEMGKGLNAYYKHLQPQPNFSL